MTHVFLHPPLLLALDPLRELVLRFARCSIAPGPSGHPLAPRWRQAWGCDGDDGRLALLGRLGELAPLEHVLNKVVIVVCISIALTVGCFESGAAHDADKVIVVRLDLVLGRWREPGIVVAVLAALVRH
jgi:hypothetical protein